MKNVVLGVTGSIAAYKSADIIRRLQDEGCTVSVIMTAEAEKFITPLSLSSLSGQEVHNSMFDYSGAAWQMGHLRLAKEAGVLLIAPATANILGKLACGLADDLLTCTALATRAPILVAPAMNEDMYTNTIVQRNIRTIKDAGMKVIEPVKGKLACGITGQGHLADVDVIVKAALAAFKKK